MSCTARVLYADTDQMGLANHAAALRWFEQARAEWLRARGRTYREVEAEGAFLPVYELNVRYQLPARYDDLLDISAAIERPTAVRVHFHYEVRRQADGALLIRGQTRHACVDGKGQPRRFPADLYELLCRDATVPRPPARTPGGP